MYRALQLLISATKSKNYSTVIDISIIYIATGPYIRYWPEFHRSAETFLFRGSTRKYFLATDDINIVANSTYENTSVINIEHKPWYADIGAF